MRIGYSVEGHTDKALLWGLRNRWCPQAELVQGRFRGESGQSLRREIRKTCTELCSKGVDIIIFLCDANRERWREVLRRCNTRCGPQHQHLTVFGVCDRNVECWLCSDVEWIAQRTRRSANEFRVDDPKGVFESAMGITTFDPKENEIADLVQEAPLNSWLTKRSWEDFYDKLWQKAKEHNCTIENLRESP